MRFVPQHILRELDQLHAKAIALCHQYEEKLAEMGQGGMCLDQLLRPDTP